MDRGCLADAISLTQPSGAFTTLHSDTAPRCSNPDGLYLLGIMSLHTEQQLHLESSEATFMLLFTINNDGETFSFGEKIIRV